MPRFTRFICLPLLAGALGLAAGCGRKSEPPQPAAAVKLEVIELGAQDMGEATMQIILSGVRITGTLNPAVRVEIKAQVSGQMDSIYADRGTVVTQRQVLAVTDDRAAKAQVESVKSQLAAAERDFNSSELLFKAGAASERAYVNAKVSVDSAKAQLTQAQQTVERGTIQSPIDGVISERAISAGEVVSPGQRLFAIVNSDNLECSASILPYDVVNIKIGQAAFLTLSAYHNRRFEGRIDRIDPVADPKSRRVGVYIRIPNQDRRLVAGLFASGTILTNALFAEQKVLVMPSAAVREENGVEVVYAVENDRLARHRVEIDRHGGAEEGLVEVRSGLQAGTRVVLSAPQELKDGMPVKIINTAKSP